MTNNECNHYNSTSTRAGEVVACAWACDDCSHLTPFTDMDYEALADVWIPRKPEGMTDMAWLFKSRESKFAHYAR